MAKVLSRRESNKERTRAAILEAARAGFARHGVNGMTMDDIASDAEVSRTTLFNYFTGKGEILDHLVMEMHESFYDRMDAYRTVSDDAAERVLVAFSHTGRLLEEDPENRRPLIGYTWLGWNEGGIGGRIERLTESFENLMEGARPVADAPDLHALAEMMTGMFIGMIHSWYLSPEYPLEQRLTDAARWIGRMLEPPAAR